MTKKLGCFVSHISDRTAVERCVDVCFKLAYDVLHNLEDSGFLDPSNTIHLFCAHYVFLPRLQRDLDTFTDAWNDHSIRTEQKLSPNQLWEIGLAQNPVNVSCDIEV